MKEIESKDRITIQIADSLDGEKLVVEIILDDLVIIEISKIDDKLASRILVSTNCQSQPIDFSLFREALRIAAEQAETL
ncbi:hypothetical protein ACFP81_15055 [Deinococcus lacus]|uniref:Uncharacterized protein n=1 Tax=Deinococcus lacus TaxID=392561 RepID=A0ABW1YFN1_9DEIO